jgi:hypothetical protein
VSVKNALPDNEYEVILVQVPGSVTGDCPSLNEAGVLTTNGQGNGNLQVTEPVIGGATGVIVLVFDGSPLDFYQSDPLE